MTASYRPRQSTAKYRPQDRRRVGRPNPRVPVDPQFAELVAEVRLAIVARAESVGLEMFPVVTLAAPIVRKRCPRTGGSLWPEILAEVVEAVLACPVTRLALRQAEMHVA